MRPVEWVTIIALIFGPLLAIAIQLGFEQRREERRRKLAVLDSLMSYRGRFIHNQNVLTVNRIDLVFYKNADVRRKFGVLLDHLESDAMKVDDVSPQTMAKTDDLAAELISEVAKDIGYAFDHTVIKRKAYYPKAFNVEVQYQNQVRAALLPILQGKKNLNVIIKEPDADT